MAENNQPSTSGPAPNLVAIVERLEAQLKQERERGEKLRILIRQAEVALDNTSAIFGSVGDLCVQCHAKDFNPKVGIIHKEDCIMLGLRTALK